MSDHHKMIKTNRHDRRTNLKRAGVDLSKMSEAKANQKETVDGPRELPDEMREALESGDEDRVTACVDKLMEDGWDLPDLIRSFESHRMNMLIDNVKQRTENMKKGNDILLMN